MFTKTVMAQDVDTDMEIYKIGSWTYVRIGKKAFGFDDPEVAIREFTRVLKEEPVKVREG